MRRWATEGKAAAKSKKHRMGQSASCESGSASATAAAILALASRVTTLSSPWRPLVKPFWLGLAQAATGLARA